MNTKKKGCGILKRSGASVLFVATAIVVAALLALGLGRGASAATLTVVNNNDSGAGSLRQAIADAAPGDTIDFNAGLSGQTITLTTGELLISNNLTITGPAGGITVSGNNASRVFEIGVLVTANISYLKISSGNTADTGGGILNDGTLTLTNSTVSGNTAPDGGGIFSNGRYARLNLTSSSVSGNSAPDVGGGIFNYCPSSGCTMTVTNSTVSGNASNIGGGIGNVGGTTALTNSAISGNASNDGGGIFNGGTMTVTNTTVSGNTASSAGIGGGIDNGYTLTLTNSTISGNSARLGGGINNGSTLTMTNSIVANQASGGDCLSERAVIVSLGYNLDSDGTCHLIGTGDLPSTNPLLDPLALNPPGATQTQALRIGSPAIDHIPPGVNGCGTTISTDQRGVSRPQGSGCDIGAYELLPATPTPSAAPVGGIVELLAGGSDAPQAEAASSGSSAEHIALVAGGALAVILGGWYCTRRWLR